MTRVLSGEGYLILFTVLAFGLPMMVWNFGEDWLKEDGIKPWIVMASAVLAFIIGVILASSLISFFES